MKDKTDISYKNAFTTAVFVRGANMMTGFIDGVLTGMFLGVDAMTAYGIAVTYFTMNAIISYVLVSGSQLLCSEKIGKNRLEEAKNVFALSVWTSFFISALVTVLGLLFAEPFAVFLGARGNAQHLAPTAAGYLRWLFIGNLFHNFISVASGAIQMDGGAKLVRISGITTCIADVAGDLLNIFVFRGGLEGMGAATAISNVCAAAVLFLYFFRSGRLFSLNPVFIRLKYLPEFLRLGYSQAVHGVASFFGNTAINRLIISRAGLSAMFGMTVFKNVLLFINPVCCAVGDANLLLLGLRIGECDREGADRVCKSSARIILQLVPVGLLLMLLSRPIAGLYTPDRSIENLRCAQTAVIALGIQIPFTALFLASVKGLQAFRNQSLCSVMNLAKGCVFPCCLLLVFANFGAVGVFASVAGAEALAAVFTAILFRRERRTSRLLNIPDEDVTGAVITDASDAVAFSSEASSFCRNRGADKRVCYYLSLCIEEMAVCLLRLAKGNDVKAPAVNIKIYLQDNKITMRIRDNCPLNDLRQRAEEWSPDDAQPERFIGTRIALKLSDEFRYIPLMNENNTILTFRI